MILYELFQSEDNPVYQELETSNALRQYDFLRSMVLAAVSTQRSFLSQQVLKALNYQAIVCLHTNPGEYRPCPVYVGNYTPPQHYRVQALMDDLVNIVNVNWNSADPIYIASFVLWRLNHIHPFINGNGRTARAACYFILCARAGNWLPGDVILPELLKRNRDEYVAALQHADNSISVGDLDLSVLHALIERLLLEQLQSSSNQNSEHVEPTTEAEAAEQAAAVIDAASADAAALESKSGVPPSAEDPPTGSESPP